jgi:pimeloyl-ACP methyl ester carboxylesterase
MKLKRNGVALACEEAGTGGPPMLLVHGWGTDHTVMQPLFDWARQSRRVVTVDLRGFGQSDAPAQPYTIAGYADDLAFLIGALGLDRPVVVGHSMGGLVTLDLAARHGDRISAAVVLEVMAIAPALLEGLRPILASVRLDDYQNYVAELLSYLVGPHFDPGERERLTRVGRACRQHVLVAAMEGLLAFDSEAAAACIKCPLLYIGTGTPYADLPRFRELCPQLQTGQVVGAGHYFPLEVPAQLTAMLGRFLEISAAP